MIGQWHLGNWRLRVNVSVGFQQVRRVRGVTSRLKDSEDHCLMWDFDGVAIEDVVTALRAKQLEAWLPEIEVVTTGNPNHYHAYCWTRRRWPQAVSIVASTDYVDWEWIRLSVARGFFTLRIPTFGVDTYKSVGTVPSAVLSTIDPRTDLAAFMEWDRPLIKDYDAWIIAGSPPVRYLATDIMRFLHKRRGSTDG